MPTNDQTSLFARALFGGKKTQFFKAATSEEMKDELAQELRRIYIETGVVVSESQYVERAVAVAMKGEEHVRTIESEQFKKLSGSWSRAVPKAAP